MRKLRESIEGKWRKKVEKERKRESLERKLRETGEKVVSGNILGSRERK